MSVLLGAFQIDVSVWTIFKFLVHDFGNSQPTYCLSGTMLGSNIYGLYPDKQLMRWVWLFRLKRQGNDHQEPMVIIYWGLKMCHRTSLVAQTVKHLSTMQETGFDPWVGKIPWRRKWQSTPVLLPGKSHGQRSLGGCSPWGRRVRHDWETSFLRYGIYFLSTLCVICHLHNNCVIMIFILQLRTAKHKMLCELAKFTQWTGWKPVS